MTRIAVTIISSVIILSMACNIGQSISLIDIEVALQSSNLSNKEINEQINNLVRYCEQHQLSESQKAEIDSSLAHKSFLTRQDSVFLIEIANRIPSENSNSLFANNKIRLYGLFFDILNDHLVTRLNQNERALENQNLEIADWVADHFDGFLNNDFLKAQFDFYSQLQEKDIKNKLLAELYNEKAWSLISIDQENSFALIGQGFKLAKELKDKKKEIDLLSLLQFVLFYHNSVPNSGLALGDFLLDETKKLGYETGRGRVNYYQGNILMDVGHYPKALEQFKFARDIYTKLDYKSWFPFIYERIGVVHRSLGDFESALQNLERMYEPEEKTQESPSQVRYWLGLANIHFEMSKYAKAEGLLWQSLKLAQKFNDSSLEATALDNLSALYDELGDYPGSIEFRQKSLQKYQVIGNPNRVALSWSRLSAAYLRNNELKKARTASAKAFEYVSTFDLGLAKGRALINLTRLQLQLNELDAALESLEQAQRIFEQIESFYLKIETLNLLGETHRRLGQYESAVEKLNKALNLTEDLPTFQLKVDTYLELARLYTAQKQISTAEKHLISAISVVKQTASELVNDEQRLTFSQKIQPIFEEMVLLQLAKNDTLAAFAYMEDQRAQILRILLLENQVNETAGQVALNASIGLSTLQSTQNSEQTLQRLQNHLNEGTVFIEYEVTDSTLITWVISPDNFAAIQTDVSRNELEELISEFRAYNHPDSLATTAMAGFTFKKHELLAKRLYTSLIEPIENYISNVSTVYFAPDEALNYLSFAAIKTPQDRFLIEDFTISMAPSAKILIDYLQPDLAAPDSKAAPLAVAASEDLIYSQEEVAELVRLKPNTVALVGSTVTEKKLRQYLLREPHSIILLSTHGQIDEKRPYFSRLVLNKNSVTSTEPDDDGFIMVHEIQDLKLTGTDLVFLSACESASGRLYRGEGIIGMQRAFLIAGANSVIANLWKVEDEAAKDLTVEFFEQWLKNGYSKAEALRQAQLNRIEQIKKDSLWAGKAPIYLWAAVTLTGHAE